MKLTIAAAVIGSVISFNAMAADSSHCNVLDKGPQFNPTQLSEFDKCWINTHKADELSGVDGNVFWMKVGDDFISFPVKDLVNAGSKSSAKVLVKDRFVEKIIEVESGKIINALKADVAALESVRDMLYSNLGAKDIDIAAHLATIDGLNVDISTHLATIDGQVSQIAGLSSTISTLNAGIADVRAAIEAGGLGTANTFAGAVQRINDIVGTLEATRASNTALAVEVLEFRSNIRSAERKAANVNGYTDAQLFQYQSRGSNYDDDAYNSEAVTTFTDADNVSGATQTTTGGFYEGYTHNISFTVNDVTHTVSSMIDSYDAWDKAIEKAFDEGYAQGFDDGYDAGYADGYRDGFSDGVDSASGR